jgi:hypothetical protein
MAEVPSRRQRERHKRAQQGAKGERMPHWTLPKAMMIMLFGAVLLSIAPAIAGAIGTATVLCQKMCRNCLKDWPLA